MKKMTIEQLHELAACGVDNFTIRPETDAEAFELAAHFVELGAHWWSAVKETSVETGKRMVRHWLQGNGTFIVPREGGSIRIDITIATLGTVTAKAA